MNLAQLFNRHRGGQALAPDFSGASTPLETAQGPAAPAASSAMAGQAGGTVVPLHEQFDWPQGPATLFWPAPSDQGATPSPSVSSRRRPPGGAGSDDMVKTLALAAEQVAREVDVMRLVVSLVVALLGPDGHFKFLHPWPGQIPPGQDSEECLSVG